MGTDKGFLRVSGTLALFFMALGLATASVWAQTTVNANWTDSTGNWTTASNWGCNCVPNNSPANVFNVTIPTGDVSLDNASILPTIAINTLSAGATLAIAYAESLSVTGNVNVTNSGTIQLGPYLSSALNVGGSFTNSGDLEFGLMPDVPGTVNVKGAATNSGTVNIYHSGEVFNASSLTNTGTLNSFGTIAISGAVTNGNQGVVQLESDSSGAGALTAASLTNTGTLTSNGGTVTVNGAITNENHGSIGIFGSIEGEATLTASKLTNMGGLGGGGSDITISGNVVNGKGGEIGIFSQHAPGLYQTSLSVGGDMTNNGAISVSSEAGFFAGAGSTALTVNGNLTNSGDFEITGDTTTVTVGKTSNSGTMNLLAPMTASEFTNTGSVDLGSLYCPGPCGGSLTANNFYNAGTVNVSIGGVMVNPGGSYTQTAGSTDVDGTLMAPTVNISGGTLSGSGTITRNVVNDAVVSPGDPATMTINGNYIQNADGTLVIDIASATDFSMLDVTGDASLDGTVDFDFLNGYVPGANTDFAFLQAGSVAADFSTLDFMGINCPSCTFNLSTLSLDTGAMPPSSATPEPGTLLLFGTALLGLAALLRKRAVVVARDEW